MLKTLKTIGILTSSYFDPHCSSSICIFNPNSSAGIKRSLFLPKRAPAATMNLAFAFIFGNVHIFRAHCAKFFQATFQFLTIVFQYAKCISNSQSTRRGWPVTFDETIPFEEVGVFVLSFFRTHVQRTPQFSPVIYF